MNAALRKRNYRLGSFALIGMLAIGFVCLPLWPMNLAPMKDGKSSRKPKNQQPQPTTSKVETPKSKPDAQEGGRLELEEPLSGPASKNSLRDSGSVKLLSASENDQD